MSFDPSSGIGQDTDADVCIPSYITVDPATGRTVAVFTGGIELVASPTTTIPPTTNTAIQWLDQSGAGIITAWLLNQVDSTSAGSLLEILTGRGGGDPSVDSNSVGMDFYADFKLAGISTGTSRVYVTARDPTRGQTQRKLYSSDFSSDFCIGIGDTGYLSSPRASFKFGNTPGGIGNIPATGFMALLLLWSGRSDTGAPVTDAIVRFNLDSTAADYQSSRSFWNGSAVNQTEQLPGTLAGGLAARLVAATGGANYVDSGAVLVLGFGSSGKFTPYASWFGGAGASSTGNTHTGTAGGQWLSSSTVNILELLPLAGNWDVGSRACLYAFGMQ